MKKTVTNYKVGDKVRHVSGSHVYTIIEIKETASGRCVAKIDPDQPEYWADLADLVLVSRK